MSGGTNILVKRVKNSNTNSQWPQILAVIAACLPSFISGLFQAWTSPSIPKLISNDSYVPMTFEETSYFAIIHPLAIMIFCPFVAILNDTYGRKKLILSVFVCQLAGWLFVGFGKSAVMFFISRVLAGIGDAFVFFVVPVYMGEISEKHMRGPLGCFLMVNFFLGQAVMNAIGYYFDIPTAAFISAIFPIIHVLCFAPMPESPYWLITKDRLEEARQQLQMLRWRQNVDDEFIEIQKAVQRQLSEKGSMMEIFTIDSNRRAFIIAMTTRAAQQFSGMTAFFIYMQYIFREAGGDIPGHVSSMICMALMASGAFFATALIDRFGRRPLMMTSSVGCTLMLIAQGLYFYLRDIMDTSAVSWLPLLFMLLFIALFSVGFCVVPTMLLGELFSASIKGKAMTLANIGFGCYIMVTSKLFQVLAEYIALYAPFMFFAVITGIMTVVLYYTLTETKNRTLEEIQQDLKGHK